MLVETGTVSESVPVRRLAHTSRRHAKPHGNGQSAGQVLIGHVRKAKCVLFW